MKSGGRSHYEIGHREVHSAPKSQKSRLASDVAPKFQPQAAWAGLAVLDSPTVLSSLHRVPKPPSRPRIPQPMRAQAQQTLEVVGTSGSIHDLQLSTFEAHQSVEDLHSQWLQVRQACEAYSGTVDEPILEDQGLLLITIEREEESSRTGLQLVQGLAYGRILERWLHEETLRWVGQDVGDDDEQHEDDGMEEDSGARTMPRDWQQQAQHTLLHQPNGNQPMASHPTMAIVSQLSPAEQTRAQPQPQGPSWRARFLQLEQQELGIRQKIHVEARNTHRNVLKWESEAVGGWKEFQELRAAHEAAITIQTAWRAYSARLKRRLQRAADAVLSPTTPMLTSPVRFRKPVVVSTEALDIKRQLDSTLEGMLKRINRMLETDLLKTITIPIPPVTPKRPRYDFAKTASARVTSAPHWDSPSHAQKFAVPRAVPQHAAIQIDEAIGREQLELEETESYQEIIWATHNSSLCSTLRDIDPRQLTMAKNSWLNGTLPTHPLLDPETYNRRQFNAGRHFLIKPLANALTQDLTDSEDQAREGIASDSIQNWYRIVEAQESDLRGHLLHIQSRAWQGLQGNNITSICFEVTQLEEEWNRAQLDDLQATAFASLYQQFVQAQLFTKECHIRANIELDRLEEAECLGREMIQDQYANAIWKILATEEGTLRGMEEIIEAISRESIGDLYADSEEIHSLLSEECQGRKILWNEENGALSTLTTCALWFRVEKSKFHAIEAAESGARKLAWKEGNQVLFEILVTMEEEERSMIEIQLDITTQHIWDKMHHHLNGVEILEQWTSQCLIQHEAFFKVMAKTEEKARMLIVEGSEIAYAHHCLDALKCDELKARLSIEADMYEEVEPIVRQELIQDANDWVRSIRTVLDSPGAGASRPQKEKLVLNRICTEPEYLDLLNNESLQRSEIEFHWKEVSNHYPFLYLLVLEDNEEVFTQELRFQESLLEERLAAEVASEKAAAEIPTMEKAATEKATDAAEDLAAEAEAEAKKAPPLGRTSAEETSFDESMIIHRGQSLGVLANLQPSTGSIRRRRSSVSLDEPGLGNSRRLSTASSIPADVDDDMGYPHGHGKAIVATLHSKQAVQSIGSSIPDPPPRGNPPF